MIGGLAVCWVKQGLPGPPLPRRARLKQVSGEGLGVKVIAPFEPWPVGEEHDRPGLKRTPGHDLGSTCTQKIKT